MSANEPLQFLQLRPGANAHNVSHNAVSSCEILHLQVSQDRSHSLVRDSRFHDARKNFRLLGWLLVYQPWSYIKTILSLLVRRDIRFFPPPFIAGKTLWFSCLSRTFCLGAMFAAAPADDCSGRAKVGNSRKSQVVQTSKQNNAVHMPGAVNRKTHFDQRGCSQQLLHHSAAQASQLGSHQEGAECYRPGNALHAAWEKRANDHSSIVFSWWLHMARCSDNLAQGGCEGKIGVWHRDRLAVFLRWWHAARSGSQPPSSCWGSFYGAPVFLYPDNHGRCGAHTSPRLASYKVGHPSSNHQGREVTTWHWLDAQPSCDIARKLLRVPAPEKRAHAPKARVPCALNLFRFRLSKCKKYGPLEFGENENFVPARYPGRENLCH